jgi:hypothetical protein
MKKLLLVMVFTMFPVLAHGATYYVAKTGSNSNSCTSAQSQSTPCIRGSQKHQYATDRFSTHPVRERCR